MDKRLLILMGIALAGSAAFFVYRKMYYKHEGIHYTIRPRDAAIRVADSVTYSDQTPGANRWKWDFGDGEFSSDQSGAHTYLNPGAYKLGLTVYGAFGALRSEDTVHVLSGDVLTKPAAPGIIGVENTTVGTTASYAAGATAGSYEWHVEGDAAMAGRMQKGASASFVFTKPGAKTIVLNTKSPDATIRKDIQVADAAVASKPVPAAPPKLIAMPPAARPVAHPAAAHQKPADAGHHSEGGLDDLGSGVPVKK